MSRRGNNGNGRKFVKTVVLTYGQSVPFDLQPGNWVKFIGEKKASRFAGFDRDGALLVRPKGKGLTSRVSTDAFRLSRNKAKRVVLSVVR
jgi:hypothetical protein